jgi:hypothetical protein
MAGSRSTPPKVFGSALIAIPAKPVYWAYDKIREKLEKKAEGF